MSLFTKLLKSAITYLLISKLTVSKLLHTFISEVFILKFSLNLFLFYKLFLPNTYPINNFLLNFRFINFFKFNAFCINYLYTYVHWLAPQTTSLSTSKLNLNLVRFLNLNYLQDLSIPNSNNRLIFWNTLFISINSTTKAHPLKVSTLIILKDLVTWLNMTLKKSFSFGFFYVKGFIFILFIDACLTDDEPLWEPIEWSLVQTWILFIFSFAWVAENLIVSRYGSYTGRDKRVWLAWYKTFWLIEGYYIINYGVTCIFVIVPFYYELNYNIAFIYSWWDWYSRVFFFKFISIFSIIIYIGYFIQLNLRWLHWKKVLYLIIFINIFLAYLIYTHFIIIFFSYFTDSTWYRKFRPVDYIQLSHEPSKWGWGPAKRDHYTYHPVKTSLWFKNDGPFATSFLTFHLCLFVCLFFLFIYWVVLFRRVYTMKEVPLTLTTYCVSSLKQFFYYFLWLYFFIFLSYFVNYMRLPLEFLWLLNSNSWSVNLWYIILDYPYFISSIIL